MTKPDRNSLDYYQGYFDCLQNVKGNILRREHNIRYGSVDIWNIIYDASQWEREMYENLKNIHGDKLQYDGLHEYYIGDK